MPSAGNTFYVNTASDNTGTTTDADDGNCCCSNGFGEVCTLRDAITFANNDAALNIGGGKSDTIMLPAGTYQLNCRQALLTPTAMRSPTSRFWARVSIVGAENTTAFIDANNHDTPFTINPGRFGHYLAHSGGAGHRCFRSQAIGCGGGSVERGISATQ